MLGFIKRCFFAGLLFLSNLTSINSLSSSSMNNQEYKVRPQIVNVDEDDPVFFPFSVKTSRCGVSCNNINNPCGKLCVHDVVKNFNVKVFNLVSGTSEIRRIVWHETCKRKCRFNSNVKLKQCWNEDKCRCECKGFI